MGGILNVNQSAYNCSHSGKAVALTLLDLSEVFDAIDHPLLYDCLNDWFVLDGTVLLWIKSYL